MIITRDLKNKAAKRGHIRLTALPVSRTTFRGGKIVRRLITSRSGGRCNQTPLLSLMPALRVNSGTTQQTNSAAAIALAISTLAD